MYKLISPFNKYLHSNGVKNTAKYRYDYFKIIRYFNFYRIGTNTVNPTIKSLFFFSKRPKTKTKKVLLEDFYVRHVYRGTSIDMSTTLSVDEILWCDHSNETFLAVLLHGSICF